MSSQKSTKPKKQLRITNPSGSSSFKGESSSKRDQVYNTVNVGLDVVANIAEGSDILGPLKAACRATKSVLDVVQAIESNKEEWTDLTRRLKSYMSTLEERIDLFEGYPLKDRAVDEAFSQPLIHYVEYVYSSCLVQYAEQCRFLESMHDTVVEIQEKRSRNRLGFLKSFSKVKIDAGEIRKLNRDIEDGHRQFMEALSHFTALRIQAVEQNTKVILTAVDASAILQLPTVAFVASSLHSTCLKGTREAVLQTIWRWADDDTSDKPIFWLCDIAGSGKSTVAMSAVESWRQQGVLGGRFFFSIASSEGSTTDKFCSTIARDLVEYLPELAPHVAGAVKQHPSFMRSSLEEQFQNLVANPLHHWQGRVFIVIDALDECKSGSQRRELVETLSKAVRGNKTLRIFMTSRPDPVVQAVLGSLSIKSKLEDRLHDITHRDNIGDIALYVHQSLDGVLSEDKRRRLIDKANGLFIWASTACRMLTNETSLVPTETMYNRLISMDQVGAIDDLYGLIFERTEPGNHEIMYKMLALLLAAFEPLTTDDLDDILNYTGVLGSAKALVRNLGSVLTEDSTTRMVQFRHPTLVEYLRRCSNTPNIGSRNRVYISIANAHGQAASWCFKCLESRTEGLKFNICQIESSFNLNREIPNLDAKISTLVPRRLRYASFHWLFHMAEADDNWQSTLKDNLRHIIQVPYVLYWMEILSLTGGISRAITGLRAITSWKGVSDIYQNIKRLHPRKLEEETRSRMDEIRRFILAFSVPIQDSAPHIYISALPFTPTKSKLHIEGLNKYTNTLKVCRGLEEMYPGLPTTLRGHEDWVYSVAFSPDSSQIVSGSDDKTIRLWDTVTGQPLGEPLQGHEAGILSVAFSPDGSQIVSGSEDQNIRLWDTSTGQPLGEPLRGHYGSIRSVIFSPDGSKIVSGSDDKTIRLWDAATGQSLRPPLQGHDDAITSVVLSPDGSQIV
ncbi:related to WD40-repeat protein (notchless protein), partial [Serendipita indica DSM 11827]